LDARPTGRSEEAIAVEDLPLEHRLDQSDPGASETRIRDVAQGRLFLTKIIGFLADPETPLIARTLIIELLCTSVSSHSFPERVAARRAAIGFVAAFQKCISPEKAKAERDAFLFRAVINGETTL
jgi:hypothetical protein